MWEFSMRRWMVNLIMIVFGVAIGCGIVVAVAPLLLTDGTERQENVNMGEIDFLVGMGDMWVAASGEIAPPEDPYAVLSTHALQWDEDGFRVPAQSYESYEIFALGDSITEAVQVGMPWPDVLAAETGRSVRNLGYRGYGPVEEAEVITQFVPGSGVEIVIVGYFGGNDLNDAHIAKGRTDTETLLRQLGAQAFTNFLESGAQPWVSDNPGPFLYPVRLDLNGQIHDGVFTNGYLWRHNFDIERLVNSSNFGILLETWETIQNTLTDDQCFVLAYFPSKEEVYAEFIVPEDRQRVLDTAFEWILTENGSAFVVQDDPDLVWEEYIADQRDLRDRLQWKAGQLNIKFIDLLEPMKQAASEGQMLWYTYDTHMNQAGSDLAGRVIAEHIEGGICG